MTDKELRNLGRADLLELLIESEKKRAAEEEKSHYQIEVLTLQVEELTRKLNDREIALEESGNLAEACLRLNWVFTSAQKASEQYLENMKSRKLSNDQTCDSLIEDCQKKCRTILKETQEKCQLLQRKAEEEAKRIIRQADLKRLKTEEECKQMKHKAKQMADKYYEEKNGRLQAVLDAYAQLESLINTEDGTGKAKI